MSSIIEIFSFISSESTLRNLIFNALLAEFEKMNKESVGKEKKSRKKEERKHNSTFPLTCSASKKKKKVNLTFSLTNDVRGLNNDSSKYIHKY